MQCVKKYVRLHFHLSHFKFNCRIFMLFYSSVIDLGVCMQACVAMFFAMVLAVFEEN